MFGAILQSMTGGLLIDYAGESWILIQNTMIPATDNRVLCVAIRADATFPAPTFIIPAPAGTHLRPRTETPAAPA